MQLNKIVIHVLRGQKVIPVISHKSDLFLYFGVIELIEIMSVKMFKMLT